MNDLITPQNAFEQRIADLHNGRLERDKKRKSANKGLKERWIASSDLRLAIDLYVARTIIKHNDGDNPEERKCDMHTFSCVLAETIAHIVRNYTVTDEKRFDLFQIFINEIVDQVMHILEEPSNGMTTIDTDTRHDS